MTVENSIAQEQSTGTDANQSSDGKDEGSQGNGASEGIQQRINELTGRFHDAQRRADDMARQNQELMQLVAQSVQGGGQREAQVEIDPEEKRRYEAYTAPLMKEFRAFAASMQGQLGQQKFQQASQAETDPRVRARAAELLNNWQRDPSKGGWTPDDALTFARGEVAGQDRQRNGQVRNARGQFNANGQPLDGNSGRHTEFREETPLPQDFESKSMDEKLAILEKRLEGKAF